MAGLQTVRIIRHVLPAKLRAMKPQLTVTSPAVQERGRSRPGVEVGRKTSLVPSPALPLLRNG